jgi:hypothetical protein
MQNAAIACILRSLCTTSRTANAIARIESIGQTARKVTQTNTPHDNPSDSNHVGQSVIAQPMAQRPANTSNEVTESTNDVANGVCLPTTYLRTAACRQGVSLGVLVLPVIECSSPHRTVEGFYQSLMDLERSNLWYTLARRMIS